MNPELSDSSLVWSRELEEDQRSLDHNIRRACKRVKTSLAGKADEYLKILEEERRDLEMEIKRVRRLAERLKEPVQVSPMYDALQLWRGEACNNLTIPIGSFAVR